MQTNDADSLLKLGLIAMSKSLDNGFWFHGHVGAEVLTNTFFILEFDVTPELEEVILSRINKILDSKKEFFDKEILESNESYSIDLIKETCAENISQLSTAGHGVIYGALVLKTIDHLNGWLPKVVHDGLVALLKNTQKDYPNRYYGYDDYKNAEIDLTDIPKFDNCYSAAKYCLLNQSYFENQIIDGKLYFFQGKQLHDITHSGALIMLEELGLAEMAKKGLKELAKQIKLGQQIPPGKDRADAYVSKEEFNPRNPSFWKREVKDEHHFKLAYSVIYLFNKIPKLDESMILKKVSGHWEMMD